MAVNKALAQTKSGGPPKSPFGIWYKLQTALVIYLPASILFTAILLQFYSQERTLAKERIETHASAMVTFQQARLGVNIRFIVTDLLFFANYNQIRTLLSNPEHNKEKLLSDFVLFSQGSQLYDQIRILDKTGKEIVRVDLKDGQAVIIPAEKLQFKGQRYYFKETLQLDQGEVGVSPFDLNIEHGAVEKPLKPMIRIGTPLFDHQGLKHGIVIFNYLGNELLSNIKNSLQDSPGHYMLLNSDGYWLLGRNTAEEWGFMFADGQNQTMQSAYPAAWEVISSTEKGQHSTPQGLFTHATIHPLRENRKHNSCAEIATNSKKQRHWKIVSFIPNSYLQQTINYNHNRYLASILMLNLILGTSAWLLASYRAKKKDALGQLEQVQAQLLHKTRLTTLGQLTAIVSHEIRNPLAIIKGSVQLLEIKPQLKTDAEIVHLLEMAREGVDSCDRIIDELANYISDRDLTLYPIEIRSFLAELLTELNTAEIVVEQNIAAEQNIFVDQNFFRRAVKNILENAIWALGESNSPNKRLELETITTAERFEIRISDNGPGIAPDIIRKIYEPLFSTKTVGIGLGLPIAKSIMEDHDGGLEYHSTPANGATAILWLPLNRLLAKKPTSS